MIIIDPSEDAPNSPGERSPLKGGNLSPTAPISNPPPAYAPPPQTPVPPQFYQAVPHHSQPPLHPHRPQPRSTFSRFLKAFGVALLVLFLWSAFLESLDAIDRSIPKKNRSSRVDWVIKWRKPKPVSPSCPCEPTQVPTAPGRVLPIQYPPVVAQADPS